MHSSSMNELCSCILNMPSIYQPDLLSIPNVMCPLVVHLAILRDATFVMKIIRSDNKFGVIMIIRKYSKKFKRFYM